MYRSRTAPRSSIFFVRVRNDNRFGSSASAWLAVALLSGALSALLSGCIQIPVQMARTVDVASYSQRYVARDETSLKVIQRLVGKDNTRLLCAAGLQDSCVPSEDTAPIWSAFVLKDLTVEGQFIITITPDASDPEHQVIIEGFGQYLARRRAVDNLKHRLDGWEPVMQANFTLGGQARHSISEIERLGYVVVPIVQQVWPVGGRALRTYRERAGETPRGKAYGGAGFVHTVEFVGIFHVAIEHKLGNTLFAVQYGQEHELGFADGPEAGVFGCVTISGPADIWRKPIDIRDLDHVKKDAPAHQGTADDLTPQWAGASSPCRRKDVAAPH